jgi:hypothetical protein
MPFDLTYPLVKTITLIAFYVPNRLHFNKRQQ